MTVPPQEAPTVTTAVPAEASKKIKEPDSELADEHVYRSNAPESGSFFQKISLSKSIVFQFFLLFGSFKYIVISRKNSVQQDSHNCCKCKTCKGNMCTCDCKCKTI